MLQQLINIVQLRERLLVQEGCQPYTSLNSLITNQNITKSSQIKFISEGDELLKWGSTLVRNDQLITVACRGVVWYSQQVRQLWMNELRHLPSGNTQVDITVPLTCHWKLEKISAVQQHTKLIPHLSYWFWKAPKINLEILDYQYQYQYRLSGLHVANR